MTERPCVGFLVNPIAGIGGPAGQKGSDTVQAQAAALRSGYERVAGRRARLALDGVRSLDVRWITGAGEMGEQALRGHVQGPVDVLAVDESPTTADTTRRLVRTFIDRGAQLIVFAGGDGTARDVASEAGLRVPLLGIPAGVKMRSGCFAVSPSAAGAVLRRVVSDGGADDREAELLDAGADGAESALLGYCLTPSAGRLIQSPKSRRDEDESERPGIAEEAARRLAGYDLVVAGPGRGAKEALLRAAGHEGTLLGVDAFDRGERRLHPDLDEHRLFDVVGRAVDAARRVGLVIGVVGGQGMLLGRGNQQLSPRVLRAIGFDNVVVVAGLEKLAQLHGQPLLVDWELAAAGPSELPSFVTVIVGRHRDALYPLRAAQPGD